MLQAEDNFIFELADIIDSQRLHQLVVGHDGLLRCDFSDGDQLEFLDLRWLELQEVSWTFLVLNNCVVSEQIQRRQVL